MANGPVFDSAWVRCFKHKTLLEEGEEKCLRCKIIERNLSLKPPFDVYCIHHEWGEVKPGTTYKVVWVIKSGQRDFGDLVGYGFAWDKDSINDHIFDAENFIPVEFLTEDKKDSWLGDEPVKDNNPVLTEDDMMGIMG